MKEIMISMILIFSLIITLKAQESANNFLPESNKIIWQKVFETEMDYNELVEKVKESGIINKMEIEENRIFGQMRPINADYAGAGYGAMLTPIYVARSFFDGFAVIDYKDGRYRVTIRNIILTQKSEDLLSAEGEKETLETYAIRRGRSEMQRAFMRSPSIILDYTFTNTFTFISFDANDDW